MIRELTDVIDDYCIDNYGHTNWGWTDTLEEEDQRAITTNEKGEQIADIEGNIIFYYKEVSDESN